MPVIAGEIGCFFFLFFVHSCLNSPYFTWSNASDHLKYRLSLNSSVSWESDGKSFSSQEIMSCHRISDHKFVIACLPLFFGAICSVVTSSLIVEQNFDVTHSGLTTKLRVSTQSNLTDSAFFSPKLKTFIYICFCHRKMADIYRWKFKLLSLNGNPENFTRPRGKSGFHHLYGICRASDCIRVWGCFLV